MNLFYQRMINFLDYCLGKKDWSVRWDNDEFVITMTVDTAGRLTEDIVPDLPQIARDTIPQAYFVRWIIR